ncbi:hypothetical protein Hanom_Chr13g01242931 [Helianthus anomalus]
MSVVLAKIWPHLAQYQHMKCLQPWPHHTAHGGCRTQRVVPPYVVSAVNNNKMGRVKKVRVKSGPNCVLSHKTS